MTLKELTDRLSALSPESEATLNRQLRSWTDAGILPLVGGLRTGTGRGRMYEADAPYLAAVAIELTRFGAPIGFVSSAVLFLANKFRDKSDPWGHQLKSGQIRRNMIVMPTGGAKEFDFAFMRPDQLGDYVGGPDFDNEGRSILILNLRALWAKIA